MEQPNPKHIEAVALAGALPTLARSKKVRKLLIENLGADRLEFALAMMKMGKLDGSLGDELEALFDDEISNGAKTVWTGQLPTDYPVFIQEYERIYFVTSPELDDCGYFLSADAAKSYVNFNWMGDVQEMKKTNKNKNRD